MQTPVILNPFVVGRYVSDHYFCDREEETGCLHQEVQPDLGQFRPVGLEAPAEKRLGDAGGGCLSRV